MCLAPSKNLFRVVRAAKKQLFQALAIFWSAGKQCRNFSFFSICHHLSTVILANTTIVAFVLLRNARFSFLCYTWCEPVPTPKSARKWQLWPFATSSAKDYEGHLLMQTSFAELPNRFDWIQLLFRKKSCHECQQKSSGPFFLSSCM